MIFWPFVILAKVSHRARIASQLTPTQDALLQILWTADGWVQTDEILQQMEAEYDLSTSGSGTSRARGWD